MSGIAGIYHRDGRPVDPAVLERMADCVAHRGPDGAGRWTSGPVALGHRMLHSTPQSVEENQPLLDETATLCLTFDGRVDNRDELRTALETQGARLPADTDAEMVLRAYACWGEECPARIIGDFAFAVWDERRQQLFCARDPLGVRPFYYHTEGRTFLFASEMQPLFEGPGVRRRPNLPLLGLYLSNCFDEPEETLYEGIYRLPAAHSLVLKPGGPRKIRYWDLEPTREVRYRTDAEYTDHFLALFRDAVAARLQSCGPVGAWLSGGLDSSSIVCTAQALYREGAVGSNTFETFSVVFDELPCDERHYIDEVVRKWDIHANVSTYEDDLSSVGFDQTSQYPDLLHQTTLLMGAPALRAMRDRGIRVVLDGWGGDELLAASFDHLTDMAGSGNLRGLLRQIQHDANGYGAHPASLFLNYCLRPLVPGPVKKLLRPVIQPFHRNGISSLLKREFVRAARLRDREGARAHAQRFPTRSQQAIYNGLFSGWNATGMDLNDLFTARFSVETRRPFFDRRVVEFLIAVPEEQRWRADQPKRILRQAMDGILPEAVQRRTGKAEFSSPVAQQLRERQADVVEGIFRHSTLADLGVIDAERCRSLFRRYRGGARQYLTGSLELLVALELWCAAAVGRPPDAGG